MALDTTVNHSGDDASDDAFYGWDWTATTHAASLPHRSGETDRAVAPVATARTLLRALDGAMVLPGKGLQGWPLALTAYDEDGFKVGTVYFGGGRTDVHVLATSAVADKVRPLVAGMDARTARVDTRVDTLLPWDSCANVLEIASDIYGSELVYYEKRRRGEALGRTIYLGAPGSRIRVRLYEKWLQSPGQYEEGTNRIEVQLRPDSQHKAAVSGWDRAETFCATKTTRELAERLGADYVPHVSVRTSKGTPDLERTLEVMGQQYGPAVDRWLTLSGGDLGRVVHYLTGLTQKPDEAAAFGERLVSDQRALDDLLRGSEVYESYNL